MAKASPHHVPKDRRLARKTVTAAVASSIIVHVLIAIVAGIWVVAHYIKSEPPRFVALPQPKIKVPPQTKQHRMNLAAHAALASKPTFKAKLVSTRPTEFALPEAPKISMNDMLTPDPAAIANSMVTGLAGASGSGAGSGLGLTGAGGKGLGTGLNFMGIKSSGQRVLLLFDVSGSVVNKAAKSDMPLSKIKEETLNMIDKLPTDSRFGIIQFVRNYKPFQPELIPATQPNRDLARQWVASEWNESGMMGARGKGVISPTPNGLPVILRAAYAMKPDVIFLISDGSFERTGAQPEKVPEDEFDDLFKELTKTGKIPLNFIGFEMKPDDEKYWSRTARRQGGQFKEIK
ncbi:hypothetical protein JIN85_16205 [Luteolibacter pohnpeiensis]|uniref:VWFA domain-containing protein n=1 Tax=Luteolibacter pohnpeiensis TaxID=454153 RepID=A0A934S8W4_9BACT|nr:hypothetical protein [Luteolibacter pohnpeiensis]MBK1883963.1 hypothetical protein [Luteolibacter pohnpeiensis]